MGESPRPPAGHARACWVGRGHASKHQHGSAAPGFVAKEIAAHFQFHPDWHRRGPVVRDLVRSYYAQMRSLLRERPDLRPCLKRCRHCRILFLTHPRNAGRADLGCGFGCREAQRRQRDIRRTAAYYREHPEKKRRQNRKRYLLAARLEREGGPKPQGKTAVPIMHHVRVIVSLIERRPVGLDEILRMLRQKERQHRMGGRRRPAYGERRMDGRGSSESWR